MKAKSIIVSSLLLFCYQISVAECTLGPGDKKKKNTVQINDTPSETSVRDRNLVIKEIKSSKEILKNYLSYCSKCAEEKAFKNPVLGYVTPWNSRGYDITRIFHAKFSSISPVWLQIKRVKRKTYEFSGAHDIDKNWISDVLKRSGNKLSFLPRILFEKWKPEDLHALFNDEEEMQALVQMLVKGANKYNFNGYVLEIYIQLAGYSKPNINHFIKDLSDALHKESKLLYIVIPPAISHEDKAAEKRIVFSSQDFNDLKDIADGFSLMTYDYSSNAGTMGPNAPIEWMRKNVEYLTDAPEYRKKILMGLNFYGIKYTINGEKDVRPDPIVGNQIIELIKSAKVDVKYEVKSAEHVLYVSSSSENAIIFYPTLYSIQRRIDLANELGTGLSIWELGQGLDYFYDLL